MLLPTIWMTVTGVNATGYPRLAIASISSLTASRDFWKPVCSSSVSSSSITFSTPFCAEDYGHAYEYSGDAVFAFKVGGGG